MLPAGPCFSTQGRLGQCTSFRACYPYFKLPDFSTWETWVLGVFDTCSYFGDSGRQVSASGLFFAFPVPEDAYPGERRLWVARRAPANSR